MNKPDTAEIVAERRRNISDIRAAIAAQEEVVAGSELRRQPFVLQAVRGDVAAKNTLDKLLHDDLAAARTLSDLRLALPLAEAELRTAENAHRAAEVEARKAQVDALARQRVSVASAIDKAFADFSKAWSEYQALGLQLLNVAADDHVGNIHSFTESVDGMLRLAAALPHQPFYDLRWRHSFAPIGTSSSLAAGESPYWRLPPVEAVKAA